jgi:signal transduction histidine kinase
MGPAAAEVPAPAAARALRQAIAALQGRAGFLAIKRMGAGLALAACDNLPEAPIRAIQPLLEDLLPALARVRPFEPLSELAGRPVDRLTGGAQKLGRLVLAPLLIDDELWGVLGVFGSAAVPFPPALRPLLDAFTSQLTAGLRQAAKLRQLRAEREEREQWNAALLSLITRELRTPLAVIKGYASTLARPDVEWRREMWADSLHIIEDEADRLSRLVADLLEVSRIERHGIEVELVDLRSLFERATARLRAAYTATPIHLHVEADPGAIQADEERLEQVLVRLVDNAVQDSPAGLPVTITLGGDRRKVHFGVRYNGSGIPADQRERIFDFFCRAGGSISGTGLGLFFARASIEAHGGRIWAGGGPGQGSLFCVVLPRELPSGSSESD